MRYVCNLDIVGSPSKVDEKANPCKWFQQFLDEYDDLPEEYKGFDFSQYNVKRDTHKGSVKALLKYDVELPDAELDYDVLRAAMEDVKRFLAPLEGKGKIKEFREVLIVPTSSSGVVYKVVGLDTREDVISQEYWVLEWAWDHFHKCEYNVLWKEFGKVELLKTGKDIRGISNPPVDFHVCTARMNQHTNELLSDMGKTWMEQPFGPGMSLQGGGLNRYARWLDEDGWKKTSSDADKWDARILAELFDLVKELRYFMWDKKGMTTDEWWQRQNYYYSQKIYSYLIASNGQVFQKRLGNPSGQDSTTYDNTLIHMLIKCYLFRKMTGIGASPNGFSIMQQHYKTKLYGDDNNEAIHPRYADAYTYEKRVEGYAKFGMILSKPKDVESNSVEGHVWLGKTIHWDEESHAYVGLVNPNKILCSLMNLESADVEPELVYSRALSLMVESTWTEPLQRVVRDFTFWLYRQQIRVATENEEFNRWFAAVPTLETCKNFWLGREGPNALHYTDIHGIERDIMQPDESVMICDLC